MVNNPIVGQKYVIRSGPRDDWGRALLGGVRGWFYSRDVDGLVCKVLHTNDGYVDVVLDMEFHQAVPFDHLFPLINETVKNFYGED